MGEDVDGKTDDILDIAVKLDETFSACNRSLLKYVSIANRDVRIW